MRNVIANSMLHRELEAAGWCTFKVEANIATLISPASLHIERLRAAGL